MPEHIENYWNGFDDESDIVSRYSAPEDALEGTTVYFAEYTYEDYSGSSTVVYLKDGKLWEVNGSHCSCYGLEDQWEPEETSWEAIAMRSYDPLKAMAISHIAANKHSF